MNYIALTKLWDECLKQGGLNSEVKARIIGCKSQISTFHFFFGLCLGHRLFSITDNFIENPSVGEIFGCRQSELGKINIENIADYENGGALNFSSFLRPRD